MYPLAPNFARVLAFAEFEAKDVIEFRCARKFICSHVPIEDTGMRGLLRQPEPLLAFAQALFVPLAFGISVAMPHSA